ncbi:malate synthase domain protein, partial [Vibrio parahaemolyticus V-223/04]
FIGDLWTSMKSDSLPIHESA